MHQAQDKKTLNKYKELSKTMLDKIENQQTLLSDLSYKHMGYLSRIQDPVAAPPAPHKPTERTKL